MELEDLYIHAGNKFRIQSILHGFACIIIYIYMGNVVASLFPSHNIYSALLQRIEHCSTQKSTCRLPIYIYTYFFFSLFLNMFCSFPNLNSGDPRHLCANTRIQ